MHFEFEWDEEKNRSNKQKHGYDFEDARYVFEDEYYSLEDTRHNYGEPRYLTLGRFRGKPVLIVHVQRGNITRIISFRRANAREQASLQK